VLVVVGEQIGRRTVNVIAGSEEDYCVLYAFVIPGRREATSYDAQLRI
jgi:hypothetical protein